jgi:uncharacterized membrane protein
MQKTRLEAFSDGVFAIVITLLVLEIRLPERSAFDNIDQLPGKLLEIWPRISSYITSFAIIGLYWVFHHYALNFVAKVDGVILWVNILFLLFISFLPFPTMLMGRYPSTTLPIVIYTANLLLANATGLFLIYYLRCKPSLVSPHFTNEVFQSQLHLYVWVNVIYIIAIVLAFFIPAVSYWTVTAMAIALIIRSVIMTKVEK